MIPVRLVSIENGTLTVAVSGRVDSGNAGELEREIFTLGAKHEHSGLTLDIGELEYLSSAGLRVFLKCQKGERNFAVENACTAVYDIFQMTGFTEMMKIHRALREIDVSSLPVVGRGATGTIYRMDKDTLVKVFSNYFSRAFVEQEKELALLAFKKDIPTAISYDVVRVGKCYGIVYEMLDAKDFIYCIKNEPERETELVRMFAGIVKKLHSVHIDSDKLPSYADVLVSYFEKAVGILGTESEIQKFIQVIRDVPSRDGLLHGDCHLGNVMLQDGEPIFIDMAGLSRGNPLFDLSAFYTSVLLFPKYCTGLIPDKFYPFDYGTGERIWETFCKAYLDTEDDSLIESTTEQVEAIAACRLCLAAVGSPGIFPDALISRFKKIVLEQ